MNKYTVSCDGIDNYLYDVEKEISKRSDSAYVSGPLPIAPLRNYIYSGKASAGYLRNLFQICPSTIAKLLLSGGSDIEIVDKINKKYGGNSHAQHNRHRRLLHARPVRSHSAHLWPEDVLYQRGSVLLRPQCPFRVHPFRRKPHRA